MKDVTLATETGQQKLASFEMPTEIVDEFLIRMTKGLIRYFYRDYDYGQSEFSVRYITPDEGTIS